MNELLLRTLWWSHGPWLHSKGKRGAAGVQSDVPK